jgi:hypothetical protein
MKYIKTFENFGFPNKITQFINYNFVNYLNELKKNKFKKLDFKVVIKLNNENFIEDYELDDSEDEIILSETLNRFI